MHFNQLDISEFRGIESLSIDNIKQVNLLTGRNNCGKTSVLEAIFLLVGMSNPQLAVSVHSFRDMLLTDDEDFSYLFRNFDWTKSPRLSGASASESEGNRDLQIRPIYPTYRESSTDLSEKRDLASEEALSNTSTIARKSIDGLILDFQRNQDARYQAEISLKQAGIGIKFPTGYKEQLSAVFINSKTIFRDIDQRLDAILVRKDLGAIIAALKQIEPRLIDIRMGTRGKVYADVGMDKLVPINIMGDGIRRILAILAAVSERKNGILLIDELENGLHHSSLSILWRGLLKAALDSNIQLFITTHSYECIQALARLCQEPSMAVEKDLICLFRIDRGADGRHRAFRYDADVLIAGIEKEFEVR